MRKTVLQEFTERVNTMIYESLHDVLAENRVVTFNGTTYPNFGQCVILGGHGGSGKGFVLSNLLPVQGKVVNVDHFKKQWVKLHNGKLNNGEEYNPKNGDHVTTVHNAVKDAEWKPKTIKSLFNPNTHDDERLPNVIFDMTADKPFSSVVDIASKAKELGYNTILVWVIATRSEALLRNLHRERRVKDEFIHKKANSLAEDMPQFFKSPISSKCLDDVWLVFNSAETLERSDLVGDEKKTASVRLERTSSGFKMDDATKERLERYLGQKEADPINPKTYLSSDEIADQYGTLNKNNGFDFDRTKLPKNFLRNQ